MPSQDGEDKGDGMSPQKTKRFFTVTETAGLLGLSEPTLYRAIRAGEFPAIKVRGRYVVPAKAIDAMEASAMGVTAEGSVH